MAIWKITFFLLFYSSLHVKGKATLENDNRKTISNRKLLDLLTAKVQSHPPGSIQLDRDNYFCGNYGKPYNLYDYLLPISLTDDIFDSGMIRKRCHYLKGYKQKYTVWDLLRK